ncbi:MAG TPA: rhodanese-like domain-containing protein [Humidesulfovibrio sp.]|uniref:rhodanese-like domain-containing protein n=1 Tax=Humidesulfovibrio sp. TaxID=2910988 RepID=UPI002C55418F|nr:rhodanese-like domain-containing protein [Humidesulfovibrio sp.]HWR02527.1 rhodanese-like domain-containing protein [Humidesulfovibrio sp.]
MTAYVHQIEPKEAGKFLDEVRLGARTLLDVRQDFEYAEGHLPGAKHIPLPELSERLGELDKNLPLMAYCRAGSRSLAAANMLAGQGFRELMSLKGGMLAWEGAQAQGPADLGIQSLSEARSPAELLERAWGMELALEDFYNALAVRSTDEELATLFRRFAGFEERHRRTLYEIWSRSPGTEKDEAQRAAFEERAKASVSPGVLEGGIVASDYLGHMADPSDAGEALELAMAVEAQALDLYMRRAASAEDVDLRRTLNLLAEEERAHLKVLGTFVDGWKRF